MAREPQSILPSGATLYQERPSLDDTNAALCMGGRLHLAERGVQTWRELAGGM
jgi:hypothetical protein